MFELGAAVGRSLIHSFRRAMAHALDERGTAWLPRFSNYPY